jgi:hypothetical protein
VPRWPRPNQITLKTGGQQWSPVFYLGNIQRLTANIKLSFAHKAASCGFGHSMLNAGAPRF